MIRQIFHRLVSFGIVGVFISATTLSAKANLDYHSIFDAVWSEIAEHYYDPDFGGKDWRVIGEDYRSRIGLLNESYKFDTLIAEMLRELGDSHFTLISPSFNELMPNFWQSGDAGVTFTIVGNRPIVHRVRQDSAADLSGISPGYELISVNNVTVQSLSSLVRESDIFDNTAPHYFLKAIENQLFGLPGEKIELVVKRSRMSDVRSHNIKLQNYSGLMSAPLGNMGGSPIDLEKTTLESDIVYLRFNLWMPSIMEEVRAFIKSIDKKSKGLIIDLRGNPGGIGLMATGLAGMLVEKSYRMGTMSLRQGHLNFNVYPQTGAFLGPLAILVDNNSISTSEIFAADMKETGRGRLFGVETPGAALPSVLKKLPNRYFLQMAIADYVTSKGTRIENSGVNPDVHVVLSPARLRKGHDNVVEAAQKWILRQN